MNRVDNVLTAMEYSVQTVENLPRLTICQHVEPDGTVWGTLKRTIVSRRPNAGWTTRGRFPFCAPRDFFGWSRPTARAMRADKCNVFVNRAGAVLGIRGGTVFTLTGNVLRPLFEIQGDCVLHRGICEDHSGWTYFGEYFMNRERGPVRIFRLSPQLDGWETAYEFPAGRIRHVHGVFPDPYDDAALWVTVGDYAGECYLLRTRDQFRSLETFGDGTQTWRAVALFFQPDYVCWLTDSHIEQNYACRMNRRTATLERGQPVPCSAWYGAQTGEGLCVAFTTVEPGPAIQRTESSILVSRDAFEWHEACRFGKDAYRPMRVFKYGVISCPSGELSASDFWISGEGLVGLDGSSRRLCISENGTC